ncbi:PucR family transcriptional regulator [Streptomyces heilongjiangensis]|uniref:PucR family transcriptional regulator n=1 Tax=Streptomyces heilongjiangensis TaxID=945052 RepID=A0ABW1BJE9_9ACTN|nr:helix-turn-helix domain-containing protein [Streptomyces heilongjiangensis]MDC2951803.1 helix-turn-helix domain-containing protein [Streptomyces heilongjiangensis]
MTTYAGTVPDLHPLFASEGDPDADEARRRVTWEIFSALTEVVSGQGDWSEQSAARVRAEGRAWARDGGSVDELLTTVRSMTRCLINRCTVGGPEQDALTHEVMVLRLGDACRRVSRELNCGFYEAGGTAESPAAPPAPARPRSAQASAVLSVRTAFCSLADLERVFRARLGTVVLAADEGAHVLLPAAGQQEAVEVAREAHADLPGDVWIAVHWQDPARGKPAVPQTPDPVGLSVADGICATLLALDCPPGVYELDDVLVEYGAAENPEVSERLLRMVEPLQEHPVLWETLTALIAADGVRHRACERLGVHRNTLDRRLQRIRRLTGQRLDGLRGLSTLRAALAVVAVTRLQRSAGLLGTAAAPESAPAAGTEAGTSTGNETGTGTESGTGTEPEACPPVGTGTGGEAVEAAAEAVVPRTPPPPPVAPGPRPARPAAAHRTPWPTAPTGHRAGPTGDGVRATVAVRGPGVPPPRRPAEEACAPALRA